MPKKIREYSEYIRDLDMWPTERVVLQYRASIKSALALDHDWYEAYSIVELAELRRRAELGLLCEPLPSDIAMLLLADVSND